MSGTACTYDIEEEKQMKERAKVRVTCGAQCPASLYPWYGKDACMYGHEHVIRLNFQKQSPHLQSENGYALCVWIYISKLYSCAFIFV